MKNRRSGLLLFLLCLYLLPAARGQQVGWQSARGFGGYDNQNGQPNYLSATAPDAAGNQYVVGAFIGVTDFGGITLATAGYHDGFVAKYDSTGQVQWVRLLSGPSDERLRGVCVNPAGGCYVTGEFGPQSTLDGINRLTGSGVIVAAYDADGRLTWSDITTRNNALSGSSFAHSVSVDEQGRCYVIGAIPSLTRAFGQLIVSFPRSASSYRMPYVCCYGRDRQLKWVKATTTTNTESYPVGIVGTRNGCVVTAYYSGKAASILGVPTDSTRFAYLAAYYDFDGLVVALDSLGAPLWSSQIKNPVRNTYLTPPIISGQQVLVAGAADTLTTFSQSGFSFTAPRRLGKTFVAAYDLTTGTLNRVDMLAQGLVDANRSNGAAAVPVVLRVYPDGIYLGGYFGGKVQFGTLPPLTNLTQYINDGFVAKFDLTGARCEWVVPAVTAPSSWTNVRTTVKGLGVSPTGGVIAWGEYFERAVFGSITLPPAGLGGMFTGRIGHVMGLADLPPITTTVSVWPNPAHDQAWLRASFQGANRVSATLLDALGRAVRTVELGAEPTPLDCRGLPGGVYTIRFIGGNAAATRRLVVQP